MYEKFECKYMKISESILSLYHKNIEHASSCPNSTLMAIKAHLNSTYVIVFIISIYVTHVKFYGVDDQAFNPLEGTRKFLIPKMSKWALFHPASYWWSFPRSKVAGA